MYLPSRVTLSKAVTDRFRVIKTRTGVPHNVLSRIAIMLAIASGHDISAARPEDAGGQTLDRDLLFGEQIEIYEVLLRQLVAEHQTNQPIATVVSALVEIGAHKMAHVRSLSELCDLSA